MTQTATDISVSAELKASVRRMMSSSPLADFAAAYATGEIGRYQHPFRERCQKPWRLAWRNLQRGQRRSPDRKRSDERRRRLVFSRSVPGFLAEEFGISDTAVMRILCDEYARRRFCDLALDAIMARAGVSCKTVKRARRRAERLTGLHASALKPEITGLQTCVLKPEITGLQTSTLEEGGRDARYNQTTGNTDIGAAANATNQIPATAPR